MTDSREGRCCAEVDQKASLRARELVLWKWCVWSAGAWRERHRSSRHYGRPSATLGTDTSSRGHRLARAGPELRQITVGENGALVAPMTFGVT